MSNPFDESNRGQAPGPTNTRDAVLPTALDHAENAWNLSAEAVRIANGKRGHCWGNCLLGQILKDEIERSRSLRWSPPVGTRASISTAAFQGWLKQRVQAFMRILTDLRSVTDAISKATGTAPQMNIGGLVVQPNAVAMRDGDSGSNPDIDALTGYIARLVAASRRVGAYYRQVIEWVHSVRNANVDPRWRSVAYELSFMADGTLRTLESIAPRMIRVAESTAAQIESGTALPSGSIKLKLELKVEEFDSSRFDKAMEEAAAWDGDGLPPGDVLGTPGQPGYLYILTNPSLGSLIKIGRTTRSPHERVNELSAGTAIPTPFVLAFDAYVEDCFKAEEYVHSRLEKDGYRVAANREFFNVDVATAIAAILEAQKAVSSRGDTRGSAVRQTQRPTG